MRVENHFSTTTFWSTVDGRNSDTVFLASPAPKTSLSTPPLPPKRNVVEKPEHWKPFLGPILSPTSPEHNVVERPGQCECKRSYRHTAQNKPPRMGRRTSRKKKTGPCVPTLSRGEGGEAWKNATTIHFSRHEVSSRSILHNIGFGGERGGRSKACN